MIQFPIRINLLIGLNVKYIRCSKTDFFLTDFLINFP